MQYLFVVSGAFSALFFLLLYSRKDRMLEHSLLGTIFFLITINCSYVFMFTTAESAYYKVFFSELNYAIPLLYGPLLWFYTKALTVKNFKLRSWDYWHFVPFILFLGIILIPAFTIYKLPTTSQLGYPIIKIVTAPYYLFATIRVIRDYHQKFLEEYSYEQEVNLLWMNWIVTGAVILWIIAAGSYVYNLFNEQSMIMLYDVYTLSFLGLYLFGLAFVAVRKTDLFSMGKATAKPVLTKFDTITATETQVKTQEDDNEERYFEKDKEVLLAAMETQEPYLDPKLTLQKLSNLCGVPSYRLTKLLKGPLNSSFYDFINMYRVEKVKNLLAEGRADQLSMLGIAEESGFNSKASFNRIFKLITGQTPTAYLKSLSN